MRSRDCTYVPCPCLLLLGAIVSFCGEPDFHALPGRLQALCADSDTSYAQEFSEYFEYYGLTCDSCRHRIGRFPVDSFSIAAHVFEPDSARATVFVVHGYLDHVGYHGRLIRFLLGRRYAVCLLDLPGHGLSTGRRASVDDFSQYAACLDSLVRICRPHVAEPLIAIGHSAGCAAIYEYLHLRGDSPFAKTIFLAPLVRSTYWVPARVGYFLAKPILRTTARLYRNSSSDKRFLAFHRSDPLRPRHFPLRWSTAYYRWEERVRSYPVLRARVSIVQGTKDDVVDWRYNVPFLQARFDSVSVNYIENARHHLMNESEDLRTEFFDVLSGLMGQDR
jgi:alpha-beta hydrolase superfamily lysophospholipase